MRVLCYNFRNLARACHSASSRYYKISLSRNDFVKDKVLVTSSGVIDKERKSSCQDSRPLDPVLALWIPLPPRPSSTDPTDNVCRQMLAARQVRGANLSGGPRLVWCHSAIRGPVGTAVVSPRSSHSLPRQDPPGKTHLYRLQPVMDPPLGIEM